MKNLLRLLIITTIYIFSYLHSAHAETPLTMEDSKKIIFKKIANPNGLFMHQFSYFKTKHQQFGNCLNKENKPIPNPMGMEFNFNKGPIPNEVKFQVEYKCTMFDLDDNAEEVVYLIRAQGYMNIYKYGASDYGFVINNIMFLNI